jgi:hypothetical protein
VLIAKSSHIFAILVRSSAILLLATATGWGQHPHSHQTTKKVWPAPVRHVSAVDEPAHAVEAGAEQQAYVFSPHPVNQLRSSGPLQPHQVIRSPFRTDGGAHQKAERQHPPHSSLLRRTPKPAVLPEADQRETWKTPYSYGYFGASGTRHWNMHHGYRDRYVEWRLQ